MAEIELFQFHGSHFNEKARWALDLKGVPHRRHALLPGPHMPRMWMLTGQSQTPALRIGDGMVTGSANIIDRLDREFPEPGLYPTDPAQREQVLAIVREFDEEVGPAVRLAKFSEAMEARVAVRAFCWDRSALVQGFYYASFPILWRVMQSNMGITEEAAAEALERTQQAFDSVAKLGGSSGYLVGDRFTVADLTCASLLMPAVAVAEWGGPQEPATAKISAWLARWAEHPGAEWVREMYRRHRRM